MLIAIAYRYGTTSHTYIITASNEEVDNIENTLIYASAKDEWENRGGKYGVAIHYVTPPDAKKYGRRIVHYFPSICEEDGPNTGN